ncbi:C2H2-type zinc finger transcription factor [Rhizophagus clarus]|nr:C2H2-type zinc finger transcription factor [Rhizophagus clarus]
MTEPYVGYSELVRYLKDNDNATWSYAKFLTLHRDTLLKSPPFLNEWFHLDGRWANRFLYKIKELDPSNFDIMENKVKSERANNRFQLYWEEILYERKEILANQIHLNASMDLLGIAGKQNFQKAISRGYLKTFSETNELQKTYTESQETILDFENDPFLDKDKDENHESSIVNSYQSFGSSEPQETILDFENNPFLDKDKDENHESSNYSMSSESGFDDATESSSGTLDSNNEDGFMNDDAKLEYKTRFLNMNSDNKWKLPSNNYVEDILYQYAKDLPYENQLHSFIIDTCNETIMDLFDDVDQEHIITYNSSPEIEMSDELVHFLMRYRKFQPNEMREVVNSGINISPYDPKQHFNFHYIHQVFSQLLPRYELRPNDFTRSHLEGWFASNIWSAIVDACFIDLETIEFVRGEGCSSASRQRKNRERKCSKTKKIMGRKCDGIARDLGSPEEFAVSEEGSTWTGEDGTKYLSDGSLKMPKLMRDMLLQKIKNHGVNFVKNNQIEIVGFLHSAQYLQVFVMDIPSGYMCRLRRYPSSRIPTVLSEVDDLISLISDVLIAKLRITRCLERSSDSSNKTLINSNEALKKRLKKKAIVNKRQEKEGDYEFPNRC